MNLHTHDSDINSEIYSKGKLRHTLVMMSAQGRNRGRQDGISSNNYHHVTASINHIWLYDSFIIILLLLTLIGFIIFVPVTRANQPADNWARNYEQQVHCDIVCDCEEFISH